MASNLLSSRYRIAPGSDFSFAPAHIHSTGDIADLEKFMPLAYELKVIALMFMLAQRLYQYYEASRGKVDALVNPDVLLYRRITDFIAQNYHEKLTLDMIASSGNISRSKCCALFKEAPAR